MWDWLKKVGKVALTAAPYIAAPFTGGASLALTPATQALEKKWAQHDANENIKKGIAPSSFDKYLGMAGDIASIASPAGALGALGKAGSVAGKIGKAATIANAGLGVAGTIANSRQSQMGNDMPSQGGYGGQIPPPSPRPMMNFNPNQGIGPSPQMMNQGMGQQSPYDIGSIINRGREDALKGLYRPSFSGGY